LAMPYTEIGKTWSKLRLIAECAKGDPLYRFTSLAHLLDKEFLGSCYRHLDKDKAVGVDNVSWEDYGKDLDANLDGLVARLRSKSYKPIPAKRVYIPKNETEKRPLGISALENKIVERALAVILGSIYEEDFLDCSYGFRPGRGCHQALKALNDLITRHPGNHVVEADIKGFFDNVSHELLLQFLRVRIADSSLLALIGKFLKAGYIDDRLLVRSEKGTPQGSIVSPTLANVFLHYVLDVWFETVVKAHVRGFCGLVRYADDFVCVVQLADDAERIERALKRRFEKHGLEIHPTKSRRISFGRYERENAERQGRRPNTFDFLGFTHFCGRTRNGKFKVGRRTSRKKFVAKCKAMNDWLRKIRNMVATKEWWQTLRAKLRGHYEYYGVSENYAGLAQFYKTTVRMVHKWLNRRSQKRKMNWERFKHYLECYPLPKPKICHSFYGSPSVP
jgi:RNA-directed DNA polymerase